MWRHCGPRTLPLWIATGVECPLLAPVPQQCDPAPGVSTRNSLQRADAQRAMCRLMMEFQGDIETCGGSVALNSSAISGDVSGELHSRLPSLADATALSG